MEIEKFKCKSCGKTVSVNREHIEIINMGIEFILKTSDIRDFDKIAYLSRYESGTDNGRVILPDTDNVSSILNNIFICCKDRNWTIVGQDSVVGLDDAKLDKSDISKEEFLKASMTNDSFERPSEYDFVYRCLCSIVAHTVLDVGCCESNLSSVLKDIGYDVYGIDVNNCNKDTNFKFINGNILDHDFGMKFDVIIAISTVEHVGLESYKQTKVDNDGDIEAMKRLYKYAKKYLILTVPFGKAHHPAEFERVYDTPRLKKLMEGFTIIREEYYANVKGGPNDTWEKVNSLTATDKDAVVSLLLKVK